jgi:D-inositol-3-phosphate glycosyltransferase
MNVYILETSKKLAARGVEVDIFTRATSPDQPATIEAAAGVTVHHVEAGPYGGLQKEDLPGQLCAVTAGILRAEAARPEGWYDVVHSHYWLSGHVGWLTAQRWNIPLVHSMHTMAKVKNLALAAGDTPEPQIRIIGEEQVVREASRLIANTHREAAELIEHYDADPNRVSVVHPGVDLEVFSRADGRAAARQRLGYSQDEFILLYVGRIQPLKAPDVLLMAAAEILAARPELRKQIRVVICGGPSGSGREHPEALNKLAQQLGIADRVDFLAPKPARELADLYRAADLVTVPSYSESFGLVAVEAQACGTPVIAAAVGGLVTAVKDNASGLLIGTHSPAAWATAILRILDDRGLQDALSLGALHHASKFSWTSTADALISAYSSAMSGTQFNQLRRAQ